MTQNIDYEALARKHGWIEVDRDPSEDRVDDDPCLWHPKFDYAADLHCWKDACELIGLLDDDTDDGVSPVGGAA